MERVYEERINWEDFPSTKTPVDKINLNKMDYAINEIDKRVVDMHERLGGDVDALPVEKGGTGANATLEARNNLLGDVPADYSTVTDSTAWVGSYSVSSKTDGVLRRSTMIYAWNYIKGKIKTVLGLDENDYNGTSAKAKADENGSVIADTYATKDNLTSINQTLGYTAKNLVRNTAVSTTENGVTFTVNDDGSVTLNGTAINDWSFFLNKSYVLPAGQYILSGCPDGGSNSTYYLRARGDKNYNNFGGETVINGGGTNHVNMYIFFREGQVFNNLTFYPMIRHANVEDSTYEAYTGDVIGRFKELTPINNLLATIPGSPLDATQGKVLSDLIIALQDSLTWKLLGSVTGSIEISLGDIEYRELYIEVAYSNQSYIFNIPKSALTASERHFTNGSSNMDGVSTPYLTDIRVNVSTTQVVNTFTLVNSGNVSRVNVTEESTTTVYYR